MSYTIVGLFPSQEQAKAVSESLENKGFKNSDYIVYLNDNKHVEKKSFWTKLFTNEIDEEVTAVDSLITSVAINGENEQDLAVKAFTENNVVNTYILEDVTLEDAKNLDYVKKVVTLKAKTHIYSMPEIKTSHSDINSGINAEVNVGK